MHIGGVDREFLNASDRRVMGPNAVFMDISEALRIR
jgi:hypothetical protein